MSFMKVFAGLAKTRARMKSAQNTEHWHNWRDRLLAADIGTATSTAIVEEVKQLATAKSRAGAPPAALFAEVISRRLRLREAMLNVDAHKPAVILLMGANGSGKTTTIAKLSRYFLARGKKILLAAGDTFRAAAKEQLQKWAATLGGLEVISGAGDPAAVAYNAAAAAAARQVDIALIDTSGRLPAQANLMAEMGKIRRAINKALPGAPHELLLILDATSGQNTLSQIEKFKESCGVTGLIITKLDSSAKGGFLLAMGGGAAAPIRFIGTGEGSDDLELFDADEYAAALLGLDSMPGSEAAAQMDHAVKTV